MHNPELNSSDFKLEENGTFVLPTAKYLFPNFEKSLAVNGENFHLKEEFHLTIIGKKLGKQISDMITQKPELKGQIEQALDEFNWQVKPTGRYFMIKPIVGDLERKTIIAEVRVSAMNQFYLRLKDILQIKELESPFPHITTYVSAGASSGAIGINSQKEFEKMVFSEVKIAN